MEIAIYSRKSKLTDRGESIQNQIDMCKEYANNNFENCTFFIYEDEGFSGGSTDRPALARMLGDAKKKKFNKLICYRLDRISRSVMDFSNTLEFLIKNEIDFISITERFDTSTPIGRAMIYIASVFAQLERETIAERIRDNTRRLARTGRYIGSTPPFGFKSERIEYIDSHENKKMMSQLAPVPDDMEFVKMIFEKYIEFEGLAKIETWLMQNGHKNKNGNYIGTAELRRLLTNPVYVKATESVYDYYVEIGTEVVNRKDEFNGKNGMLIYGRHDRNNGAFDPEKWFVVLARHEGIINADEWLSIQYLIEKNKDKAPRAGSSKRALLTSKIKCGDCGGTMVVIYGKNNERHYYKCRNKIKSRKAICNIKNIIGRAMDEDALMYLKNLSESRDKTRELFQRQHERLPSGNEKELEKAAQDIKKSMQEKESEVKNLINQLRKNEESIASKYIISEIEDIDNEMQELKKRLILIENQQNQIESFKTEENATLNAILDFGKISDSLSFEEKKKYIDKIVDKIIWNGKDFSVLFR